jgi:hypothetical protein
VTLPEFYVSNFTPHTPQGSRFTIIVEFVHFYDVMVAGHGKAMVYQVKSKTLYTVASWKIPGVRHLSKVVLNSPQLLLITW